MHCTRQQCTECFIDIVVFINCVCYGRWMDGFSTFYVGENGLVHKHVMDRVSNPMMSHLDCFMLPDTYHL